MQRNLSAHGRKMVTIVDPHIFRDAGYSIHKEAERLGLYIKVPRVLPPPLPSSFSSSCHLSR